MQVLWKSDTNNRLASQGLQAGKISVCGLNTFDCRTILGFLSANNPEKTKI